MKIAFFTPLQPTPSGISDYAEELLPSLAAQLDAGDEITLVVDNYTPANQELTRQFRVVQDANYRAGDFDVALYQMGNSPAHAFMYRRVFREPGVVVLHDLVLHHLIAWLTMNHGDHAAYIETMRQEYGEQGAKLAEREVLGLEPMNRFDYPLSEHVLRASRGVIAHSQYVSNAVSKFAPNVPVAIVPMGIPEVPLTTKEEARTRLKLPLDTPLIGTFGILGPAKRTTVLMDAFHAVRQTIPKARLVLVGAPSPNFEVNGLLDVLNLRDAVDVLGHVPFDMFHDYMAAMDVCVNLRYPTAGETSGAVLHMMAHARAVIVSRIGWFAELPDSAVAKIDVDDAETEMLRVILERVLTDEPLRTAMGTNARRYTDENCAPADASRAYLNFLHAVHEGRAVSKSYFKAGPPLRSSGQAPDEGQGRKKQSEPVIMPQATVAKVELATSNLEPLPTKETRDWRDEVTRAYVELGLREKDETLGAVARALTEMGLNE